MSRVHPGESHEPKAGGDMTANKDDDKNKSNDVRSSKTTKDDTNEKGGAHRQEKRNSVHHRLSQSLSNGISGGLDSMPKISSKLLAKIKRASKKGIFLESLRRRAIQRKRKASCEEEEVKNRFIKIL